MHRGETAITINGLLRGDEMNEKRGVELEVLLSVRMHSSIAEIISLTSKNKQVIGKSNQLNEF